MNAMHEIKEMLCAELDEFAKKGELSTGSLETIHKITDTIKNIDKIEMLEDVEAGEYSNGYSRRYYDGNGYDGNSYARKRDSMGRYSRRYSRDDGKDKMIDKIERMMDGATAKERDTLQRCVEMLENA